MLKIINNLRMFFEDCYRRINVREYAKLMRISPPTASKMLTCYYEHKLLAREHYKNYLLFHANKESREFRDLSKLYWAQRLKELLALMEEKLVSPTVVLFGSLSKAETKSDSDVDLAVFAHKKELSIKTFERRIRRKIQLFWFASLKDVKNKELANNIINGYVLRGRLSL